MQYAAVCKPRAAMQDLPFQRTINFSELCTSPSVVVYVSIDLSTHPSTQK